MNFEPGAQFGKYRIVRLLGKGGMSDVYEAKDGAAECAVALKVLPAVFSRDDERSRRFAKEIQASASLKHPNIVEVFEVGEVEGLHFYTMSLLPAGDLKKELNSGPLYQEHALRITSEIADALHYAHQQGFVHRDVKPENILFNSSGRAVLTDFGIAIATTSTTRITATGLSIGTPHYMSPEQARGQDVDSRSDIYALGVVLYEMLCGKVPFNARDSFAIGLMHINDTPPAIPGELWRFEKVLSRMLAKNAADRYQDCSELLEDIAALKEGRLPERAIISATRSVRSNLGRSSVQGRINRKQAIGARAIVPWLVVGLTSGTLLLATVNLWIEEESRRPVVSDGAPPQPPVRNNDATSKSETSHKERSETAVDGSETRLNSKVILEDMISVVNQGLTLGNINRRKQQLQDAGLDSANVADIERWAEFYSTSVNIDSDIRMLLAHAVNAATLPGLTADYLGFQQVILGQLEARIKSLFRCCLGELEHGEISQVLANIERLPAVFSSRQDMEKMIIEERDDRVYSALSSLEGLVMSTSAVSAEVRERLVSDLSLLGLEPHALSAALDQLVNRIVADVQPGIARGVVAPAKQAYERTYGLLRSIEGSVHSDVNLDAQFEDLDELRVQYERELRAIEELENEISRVDQLISSGQLGQAYRAIKLLDDVAMTTGQSQRIQELKEQIRSELSNG